MVHEEAKGPPGWREGMARMLGQAFTYVLEVRKSLYQLHGDSRSQFRSHFTPLQWGGGIAQSSLSAGVVYGIYYRVYHYWTIEAKWGMMEANAMATFLTSLVKIPISNAMRWIQINPATPYYIGTAMTALYRRSGPRGLYSGYGLSYIEDFIEMALRDRLFGMIETFIGGGGGAKHGKKSAEIGFVGGAMSGATVAYITTPFDTLRCHLTYRAAAAAPSAVAVRQVASVFSIVQDHGVGIFYRGARTRALSTGLRMAFFYMFMKVL
jgi:Mitochondrial carrier protein